MEAPEIVVPGDVLAREVTKHASGEGTHIHDGRIIASRVGVLSKETTDSGKTLLIVNRNDANLVPFVESRVLAKVSSITTRMVRVNILGLEGAPLSGAFRGIIRREDIRSTQRDKVVVADCYRPGDLLLARVISIADGQSCVLSTAGTDLGVIMALSRAGYPMIPASWTDMVCPHTLERYPRKVAKVPTEFIEKMFS